MMPRRGGGLRRLLMVLALLCLASTPLGAQRKNKNDEKFKLTALMIAAKDCKVDDVTALLGQGADVKAHDTAGRDALTYASAQRDKYYGLKCPGVVTALVKAGSDPNAARFYQSPELTQHKPSKIAIIRIEDIRPADKKEDKRMKELVNGVEEALAQGRLRMATIEYAGGLPVKAIGATHYPVMTLSESRQKLQAAGFSEDELNHPDRKRACSVLGTDAVMEVVMKNYSHQDIIVAVGHEATVEFWLTDCRTGELVWRNDPGPLQEERGYFLRAFSGMRILCEMGLTLPRYDYPKK